MHRLYSPCILYLVGLILTFSLLALLINHLIYEFPGNNYFPENTITSALMLGILSIGLELFFGKNSSSSKQGKELLYFFGIMSVIGFATNAVQLTPFSIIDDKIIALEGLLNIDMVSIITWTNHYPWFKFVLSVTYDTLPYQMSLIPLLIIATQQYQVLREYYFLMLCTVFLGFVFYYFFPTTAPASNVFSPLFSSEQIATGLKFNQIHSHISPTTNKGGLIAFPSFHAIWALLCTYLLKQWFIPCILLGFINILLILSCVLLGWHYPLDILGSFVLLGVSYYLMLWCRLKRAQSE